MEKRVQLYGNTGGFNKEGKEVNIYFFVGEGAPYTVIEIQGISEIRIALENTKVESVLGGEERRK